MEERIVILGRLPMEFVRRGDDGSISKPASRAFAEENSCPERERVCAWWPRNLLRRGKGAAREGYDMVGKNGKNTKPKKPIDKPSKYVPVPLSSTSTSSSSSSSSYESATPSATSTATPTYLRTQRIASGEYSTELRSRNRKSTKRYAARDASADLYQSPTHVRMSAAAALPNMTASALGIRNSEHQSQTPETPAAAHVPRVSKPSERPTFSARTTSLGALPRAFYTSGHNEIDPTVYERNGIEQELTPPPAPTTTLDAHKKVVSETLNPNPCSSPENPYLPRPLSSQSIRTSEEWLAARAAFSDGQRTPTRALSSRSLSAYSGFTGTSHHDRDVDIEAQDTAASGRTSWLSFGAANGGSNIRDTNHSSGHGSGSGKVNGKVNGHGNGNGNGWLNRVDDAVTGLVGKVVRWTENADGDEGLLLPVAKGDRLG